jgi:hypothetical protein
VTGRLIKNAKSRVVEDNFCFCLLFYIFKPSPSRKKSFVDVTEMFKYNYDVHETMRRLRRLFDGKITYRKLLLAAISATLIFIWLVYFFGGNDDNFNRKGAKGKSRGVC